MSPRAAVLAPTLVVGLIIAAAAPAAAQLGRMRGDSTLRISGGSGTLARAVWHDDGDELCVHAGRQEAVARFRSPTGRVVSVTDERGAGYWTCTGNLDVPEDSRVRLVLRWKSVGFDQYARTASARIHT